MRNLVEEMPYVLPPDIRRQKAMEALENYVKKGWSLETDALRKHFSDVRLADMVLAMYFKLKGLEPLPQYAEYEEITESTDELVH